MKSVYLFGSISDPRLTRYLQNLANGLSSYYSVCIVSGEQDVISNTDNYKIVSWRSLLYRTMEEEAIPIYVVSNHPALNYVYPFLFHRPGIVVFFDYYFGDSRWPVMKQYFSTEEILSELRFCFRSAASAIRYTSMLQEDTISTDMKRAPELCRSVLESAICGISHNPNTVEALHYYTQHTPVLYVPLALSRQGLFDDLPAETIVEAKRGLNIPQDALILGSLGTIQAGRSDRLLELLVAVREQGCNAYFLIAGYSSTDDPARSLPPEISRFVRFFRNVPDPELTTWLKTIDIGYHLRFPPSGDSAQSAAELMACAKPVMMLQHRFNTYLPEQTCIRIRCTEERKDLIDWTMRLWKNPALRKEIGQNARRYVEMNHTQEMMISGFRNAISAFSYLRSSAPPSHPEFPGHLKPPSFGDPNRDKS